MNVEMFWYIFVGVYFFCDKMMEFGMVRIGFCGYDMKIDECGVSLYFCNVGCVLCM